MTHAPRSFGPREQCADKIACIARLPADQLAGYERWLRTDPSPGRRDPLPGEMHAIEVRRAALDANHKGARA